MSVDESLERLKRATEVIKSVGISMKEAADNLEMHKALLTSFERAEREAAEIGRVAGTGEKFRVAIECVGMLCFLGEFPFDAFEMVRMDMLSGRQPEDLKRALLQLPINGDYRKVFFWGG